MHSFKVKISLKLWEMRSEKQRIKGTEKPVCISAWQIFIVFNFVWVAHSESVLFLPYWLFVSCQKYLLKYLLFLWSFSAKYQIINLFVLIFIDKWFYHSSTWSFFLPPPCSIFLLDLVICMQKCARHCLGVIKSRFLFMRCCHLVLQQY